MSHPQLFGVVPAGHPLIVEPTSFNAEVGSATYSIRVLAHNPFVHLAVFLLPQPSPPTFTFPPGKAAAVYLSYASLGSDMVPPPESFIFACAIGVGKESAILKVDSSKAPNGVVTVGFAVENEDIIQNKLSELKGKSVVGTAHGTGVGGGKEQGNTTLQLAQRIITNAFNHIASHSQTLNGIEVMPLKAFQDWWNKFEAKIKNNPTFLEREQV